MRSDIEGLKKIKKYCYQLMDFTNDVKFENFVSDEKTNYACVICINSNRRISE